MNMKVKIDVNVDGQRFETMLEAASPQDLFKQFRERVQSRLPFVKRQLAKALSDQAFMKQVVEAHNARKSACEPVPTTVEGFLAFGERNGYVTRL